MDFDDINLDDELNQEILYNAIKEEIYNQDIEHKKSKIRSKKKKSTFVKNLISTLKVKTVLILLTTLIVNTYAWFIFISTVDLSVQMHVKNWNFKISIDEDEANEDYIFKVEQVYPGMTPAEETVTCQNNGETSALLSCKIKSVKIFDDTYSVGDQYEDNGILKEYTSESLLENISNRYPFKIQIIYENASGTIQNDGENEIMSTGASIDIIFKVSWDYETGTNASEVAANDKIDTEWGERAYKYAQDNPGERYGIIIEAEIVAKQAE